MRGTDPEGKPFISLRVRSNAPNAPQDPFVISFFQQDVGGHLWSYRTLAGRVDDALGQPLFHENLEFSDQQSIQNLVRGQHPVLTLV